MVPAGHSAEVTALSQQIGNALDEQELNMTAVSAGEIFLRMSGGAKTVCRLPAV